MTISNDKSGARSWGEFNEVKSRTIKPKEKDFDADKRVVGIPGYNVFGAPGSKSTGLPGWLGGPEDEQKKKQKKSSGGGLGGLFASLTGGE